MVNISVGSKCALQIQFVRFTKENDVGLFLGVCIVKYIWGGD